MADALPPFEGYSISLLKGVNLPRTPEGEHHSHASIQGSGLRDPAPGYRGARRRYAHRLLFRRCLGAIRNTPSSSPEGIRGEGRFSEFVREVCSEKEMSRRVEEKVVREGIERHC